MHALFLATYTVDCEKNWLSWGSIGHTYDVEIYDNRPHDRHIELVDYAKYIKPQVIIYIGAIEKYHKRPVPKPDILKRLREVAPTIHICGDASDRPWWEWLQTYDIKECFSIQVSIDGSFDTPLASSDNGMIKLTPTDPTPFNPQPWSQRHVQVGMAGGLGHGERKMIIENLTTFAGLDWRRNLPFNEMCAFLSSCKIIVNSPMNGTGDSVHVKGRVIETGWAGACLLERTNDCTSRWFDADEYLQYKYGTDAIERLMWAKENDDLVCSIAQRFHRKVEEEHHPRVFWHDVLDKAGVYNMVD